MAIPDTPLTRVEQYAYAIYRKLSGGGGVTVEPLTVTENGTTEAPSGTAYSPVTVNVANAISIRGKGKQEIPVPQEVIDLADYNISGSGLGCTVLFSVVVPGGQYVGVLDKTPEEDEEYIALEFSSHPVIPTTYIRATAEYNKTNHTLKLTSVDRSGTELINSLGNVGWVITIINPVIYNET